MQITDMKAIKSLCNPKNIFFLNPTKPHLCLHHRSRHLHSTALRLLATTDSDFIDNTQNASQVWSTYNPISPAIVSTNSITSNKIRASDSELETLSDYCDRDSDQEKEEFVNEKKNQSAEKDDLANERVSFSSNYKKKGKSRVIYVCENCGNEYGQWWGSCRSCGKVATLKRISESDVNGSQKFSGRIGGLHENITRSWLPQKSSETRPLRLKDVNQRIDQLNWRIPLPGVFGTEVARVLGGGIIPGSLILVGGDPGVGKSTMLLQIAALIAEGQAADKRDPVVYVSGEESVEQIVHRADRLRIGAEELFFYSSTDIEDVLEKIQPLSPCALMIDSIQTAYIQGVTGSAGGITQVKECTSTLLRFAKKTNIPVFLIGHVTKSGDIAGPRVLEHIVDVVLYLEGEKQLSHRLLRTVKNRFGSTDELGVFEMSHSGLQTVSNASEMFLTEQYSGSEILAGLAVAVIMDGSRSFLIEIQALCTTGSSGSRLVNGLQPSRANMIISVLKRQANLKLQDCDIFLNVVSGVSLTEPAGDLAVAAAICSSFLEYPIPSNIAFIGEIGLGGELRMVPRIEKRVHTVAKLGYKMCLVPKSGKKYLSGLDFEGIQIIGCANLKQVIDAVFTSHN